jgi:drug/metabolite transporter (DMT)-like permease
LPPTLRGGYSAAMKRWSHVDIMLLYIVVVWGSIFTVVKLLSQELPITAVNALRFLLLAASFLVILAVRRDFKLSAKDLALATIIGVVGFGAYQLLSSFGISQSVVAGSALILATTPIFTTLFSGLFRVERIDGFGWLGVAAGAGGIAVIVAGEHGLNAFVPESVVGEAALVAGAACWAAGAVISAPLMKRHSSLKITAYSSIIGCALYLPFLWGDLTSVDWAGADPTSILLILYWVFSGNLLGQVVRFYGVKRIGPHRAAAYIYLVPFSAGAIAALVIHSPIGLHHLLGGAVIFLGIALTRVKPYRQVGKPPPPVP